MADKDWQTLAHDALTPDNSDALVTSRTSDITKIGAPVVALLGVLIAAVLGNQFEFDPSKAETVIAAAIIVSTSILGVLLVYASDFRTRGRTAAARFDALARIVQQDIQSQARDTEALRATLTAQEAQLKAAQSELLDYTRKLAALQEKMLSRAADPGIADTPLMSFEPGLVKRPSHGRPKGSRRGANSG